MNNRLLVSTCLLAIVVLCVSLNVFGQTTPKLNQLSTPCLAGERLIPCKTSDGKSGVQKEMCVKDNWVREGACVALIRRPEPISLGCKPQGIQRYIWCGPDKRQKQTCEGGKWVNTGGCVVFVVTPKPQPPKE